MLDLGSGGGIDVLLSASRVGPSGKAYGLDMTDEMLALARKNQRKAGAQNVEFLEGRDRKHPAARQFGRRDHLELRDQPLRRQGWRLARGVPRAAPGGRFAVSDVVVRGEVPADIRRSVELWIGCIAGALEESEYRAKLSGAGFADVEVEPTRIYCAKDAPEFFASANLDIEKIAPLVDGKFMSAFVRARKP